MGKGDKEFQRFWMVFPTGLPPNQSTIREMRKATDIAVRKAKRTIS